MKDRTCLITGATSGIGRRAAEELAAMGATLTLVGRNPDKTARAVDEIRESTGNDRVDFLLADLSSIEEVRRLADVYRDKTDSLNVLVNNAGAMFTKRHETADGYEMTLALNHLAYFALTNELLDLLEAGAPSRVVNVASGAHTLGTIDFDDLHQTDRRYSAWKAYSQSKLANVLFTLELARRLNGKPITVNCVHPGFVRSGFGKNDGWWFKAAVTVGGVFGRSPQKGARGLVHLASSSEVDGVSGEYFMDFRPRRVSREARDPDVAKRLWTVSEELVAKTS